jgi:hypothetical protein
MSQDFIEKYYKREFVVKPSVLLSAFNTQFDFEATFSSKELQNLPENTLEINNYFPSYGNSLI